MLTGKAIGLVSALRGDFANFADSKLLVQADAYFTSLGLQAGFDVAKRDALLREAISRVAGDVTWLTDETAAAFTRWVEGLRGIGMDDAEILAALEDGGPGGGGH
jgi:hypothetical protein